MQQPERLQKLIRLLLDEVGEDITIPNDIAEQKRLFRALVNVRMPRETSEEFLRLQDEYLAEEIFMKGITDIDRLSPILPDIYLWKGDITTLKCDGIVNAANEKLLGCFYPNHACIDNAIHTYAGVQLRQECFEIMTAQGYDEPTGCTKITGAYNLPCKYILHTVGPIVYGALTQTHEKKLASCYRSCLSCADENGLGSLAFPCISTGEFHYPADKAAQTAVKTVIEYKRRTASKLKIVFNVFKDSDYILYLQLLDHEKSKDDMNQRA